MTKANLALLLSVAAVTQLAAQPQLLCDANSGVPPVVRAQGQTELVGDVVLFCVSQSAGAQFSSDIEIRFNTTVTSRIVSGEFSEALLVLNELNNEQHVRQNLSLGVNAWQGKVNSGTIRFSGVKFATNAQKTAILRITNMRVNATGIPASQTLVPTQVVSFISTPGATVSKPQQTVAFVLADLSVSTRNAANANVGPSFPACVGHNESVASGTPAVLSHRLLFREGFQTVFKTRATASSQNTPGAVSNTESGFFDPNLGSANGLNLMGVATQATRLMAKFGGIPPGVALYVTTMQTPLGSSPGAQAKLVATDVNGSGPFNLLSANTIASIDGSSTAIHRIPVVGGAATAVWELTKADSATLETLSFGVVYSYSAFPAATAGTISIAGSFAPLSNFVNASSTEPIPRFQGVQAPLLIPFTPCTTAPNLVVESVSIPSEMAAGITVPALAWIRNIGPRAAGAFATSVSLAATNEPPRIYCLVSISWRAGGGRVDSVSSEYPDHKGEVLRSQGSRGYQ